MKILTARITPAQRKRIDEVLDIIGLADRRDVLGKVLSHGQKQWLEIGMLLMQEPELLLVDEPVAGMTPQEIERFTTQLRAANVDVRSVDAGKLQLSHRQPSAGATRK